MKPLAALASYANTGLTFVPLPMGEIGPKADWQLPALLVAKADNPQATPLRTFLLRHSIASLAGLMLQAIKGVRVGPNAKLAIEGFLLCSVPTLLALAALYFLGSSHLIDAQADELARVFGYSESEARDVIREQTSLVTQQGAMALLFLYAIYWLLAAAAGLRRGLRATLANVCLLAGIAGIAFLTINNVFYWIDGYCDQLPFPHEGFQPFKFYECPTSTTFLIALIFISLALFIVSLAFRMIHSRRG